jgi:hypothetical protein
VHHSEAIPAVVHVGEAAEQVACSRLGLVKLVSARIRTIGKEIAKWASRAMLTVGTQLISRPRAWVRLTALTETRTGLTIALRDLARAPGSVLS